MSDKKYVIFISDQFGYRCGGSNTVNIELCLALRQIATEEVEVISLVINCQDSHRVAELESKAIDLGIKIVHQNILNETKGISDKECQEIDLRFFGTDRDGENIIWIGHDIFTGQYAVRLAEYIGGESVVCIHTDYDTIEGMKDNKNTGLIKEEKQRKIMDRADKVFAIGPRLFERVREICKSDIYELIPGMPSFSESDINNNRAVITYGRFEGHVAPIKQIQLAMAAFGRAVADMNNNKDYVLHIIGTATEEEEQRLRKIAEEYAGRKLSINFLKYTQERQQLYCHLKNNCVGLMVSISEGFGMTGWEMISAGIPLILTKKSGLYDYLEERFGYTVNGMCLPVDLKGSSAEQICEEDVETVAEKIVTVFRNTAKLKEAAHKLRAELQDETWHKAAECLAGIVHIPTMQFRAAQIYSETYKTRLACIEELLNSLEIGEMNSKYLIFFGGISSKLCEERAIGKIERWLRRDKERKLFLCYETENAAYGRAQNLDAMKLPMGNLSINPERRMQEKKQKVIDSCKLYSEKVRNQITLVQIKNELQTYIMIADQDIYCTLLLETRSSEAMTMKINDREVEEKRKLVENMEHIIKKQDLGKEEKSLLRILQLLKEKFG